MSFTFVKHLKEQRLGDRFSARSKTDQELWEQFKGGSNEAFGELYKKYRVPLLFYIRCMIGSHKEEKDVFQETWIRLFGMREKMNVENVEAILIRIARNFCLNSLRNKGIRDAFAAEEAEWALSTEEASNSLELEDAAEAVRTALTRLDPNLREIIVLREIEGCDFKTIGELFEISETAARKRYVKALEEMRIFLRKWLGLSQQDNPQEHI